MDRKTNTFTAGVEEKRKREKEKITIKDVKKKRKMWWITCCLDGKLSRQMRQR